MTGSRATLALAAALAVSAAPSAVCAQSDAFVDAIILSLARTQLALDRCPHLKAGWARNEMPKTAKLSGQEIERRVAAVMPQVVKEMEMAGDRLCEVAMKIYGPDGNYMPYYLEPR